MRLKSMLALMLAVLMLVTALTGCGGKKETGTTTEQTTTASTQAPETTQEAPKEKKVQNLVKMRSVRRYPTI